VSRRRHEGGQTLIEFALVLPVFLVLLFAVIDIGRVVYVNSVVSQAAREAARLAAVEASWIGSTDGSCGTTGGPVCPGGVTTGSPSLASEAIAAANRMVAPLGTITSADIYISCNAAGSAPTGAWTGVSCVRHSTDDVVSIRVRLRFTPLTPVATQFVGSPYLYGAATMVIN
jgi:general stress protein CsbA